MVVVPLLAGAAAPAGGPPCWVPVTWKAFETCTWTSPPDFVMTWTS